MPKVTQVYARQVVGLQGALLQSRLSSKPFSQIQTNPFFCSALCCRLSGSSVLQT